MKKIITIINNLRHYYIRGDIKSMQILATDLLTQIKKLKYEQQRNNNNKI